MQVGLLTQRRAFWPCTWTIALAAITSFTLTAPLAAKGSFEPAEIEAALAAIQAKDQRLQNIGWRLVTSNAQFCDNRQSAIGLQLLDLASFEDPEAVRVGLELEGQFLVQTVAAGSPAQKAELKPNEEVIALDGKQLANLPSDGKYDWRRLAQIHEWIDATLKKSGQIMIQRLGSDAIPVSGTLVCATRFELDDGGKRAVADGQRVQIGAMFPGFEYPEDEFAAAVAHELAHNLLSHRNWLDDQGRSRRNIRTTEREADRLMPWLLANAGYDPVAALRFMQRWGPNHSGGIFRKQTHEGWDERAEHIAAELEGFKQFWNDGDIADWRQHFTRETHAD